MIKEETLDAQDHVYWSRQHRLCQEPAGGHPRFPRVGRVYYQPTRIGALPPHLAALIQTNINVQALTVEAALTQKRGYIYHAATLDPHTGAELDLDQIWSLVDDLIEAHGDWLPAYE